MSSKPVILLASHEHHDEVLDEFASRYGRDYDVHCATTLHECAETGRRLLTEDARIALVGLDLDLPDGNGMVGMHTMRTFVPTAKRIALIPSGAFSGAVESLRHDVSTGLLDAYLVIPSGRRDEEFHGAVTEMLSGWNWTTGGTEVEGVRVIALPETAGVVQIRDLLERMGIPNRTFLPDSEQAAEVAEQLPDGAPHLWLFMRGMQAQSAPSMADLGAIMYGSPEDIATSGSREESRGCGWRNVPASRRVGSAPASLRSRGDLAHSR